MKDLKLGIVKFAIVKAFLSSGKSPLLQLLLDGRLAAQSLSWAGLADSLELRPFQ